MLKIPDEFKEKFTHLLGEKEEKRLEEALDLPSKKAFRINTLKNTDNVTYDLSKSVPVITQAYYGEISGRDVEWTAGSVYSQDPAAMFPAFLTDVTPGDKVLDLCAAPGGKSTALGEKLKGQGILVANEISSSRVKILRENLERWGLTNAVVTNADSETLSRNFNSYFDEILVDAPCSGEGMFRKSDDAIKYWSEDNVLTCQARQKEILIEAVKMLKPGGQLVYSTCTFSPEEDEEIVAWLVKNYNFKIEKSPVSVPAAHGNPEWGDNIPEMKYTMRFWPQDGIGEGQFVAILRSTEETVEEKRRPKKNKKRKKNSGQKENLLGKEELLWIKKELDSFNLPDGLKDWESRARVSNGHVFVPAIDNQFLNGIKVLSNGVELGLLKKKRFEPSHQLAESLGQVVQEKCIDLSNDNYEKYLHGEMINLDSDLQGYVLVSSKKQIFSFGKMTGKGQLKNFYPKGLRQ